MKKEDWRKARAGVKKFLAFKGLDRSQTCRYAVENRDGKQHIFRQDYCHAGLASWSMSEAFKAVGGREKFDPVAVVNLLCEPRAGEDAARRFYEWLFNFSPFANVFVTKSVKRAMQENVIVVSPEHTGDMMVGGLIASRLVSEDYHKNGNYRNGWLWDQLVQRGVHPNVAFSVAHCVRPSPDYSTIQVEAMHHGALTDTRGLRLMDQKMWKFLSGKPTLYQKKTWAQEPDYSQITNTWVDKGCVRTDGKEAVEKAIAVVSGKAEQKNNPFAVDVVDVVNCNAFIEEVSVNLRNLMKEKALVA